MPTHTLQEIVDRVRFLPDDEILEIYRPLVTDLKADIVTMQMASLDQTALIEMLGHKVLPKLRSLG